jgi:hypothetical protein
MMMMMVVCATVKTIGVLVIFVDFYQSLLCISEHNC